MLDVAKAFDRVWHEGLIYKLMNFNFSKELVLMIYSFIRERSFFVSVGKDTSSRHRLAAGVPQGSILGPLLYVLYVADFPKEGITTNQYLGCYADDTAIAAKSIRPDQAVMHLQELIPSTENWCIRWRISINASKSKLLIVRRTHTRKEINAKLILFGTEMPIVKHASYLGIVLNEKLTWKHHINTIKGKAIAALTSLVPLLGSQSKLDLAKKGHLYIAVIRPILTYASPAWATYTKKDVQKLQIFQNKALRKALLCNHLNIFKVLDYVALEEDYNLRPFAAHLTRDLNFPT
ncbi:RNA-directed DNA polymerase from mobile element jockey, partial [Stegodyphus mimosarum]